MRSIFEAIRYRIHLIFEVISRILGVIIDKYQDFSYHVKLGSKAQDLALVLWDLDQELRSRIKYGNKEELQEARDLLWELMNMRGIREEDIS